MNPKVSIVIPSLNSMCYIEECLQSVLNQTLQDIEILCVDANSTDGTLKYLKELESKDKRLKVIVSDKKSYGYQMNLGIKAAKGEYLGIVESDDYIKPNMYAELYRIAKERNVEVVKGDMLEFIDKNGERIFTYTRLINWTKCLYHRNLNAKDVRVFTQSGIMNPSGIFKLSFLRENQIYHNESLGAAYQDTGFCFFTHLLAPKMFFVNEAFYCYRQDNENSSVNRISLQKALKLSKEYDFIQKKLNKNPNFGNLNSLLSYLRFGGYNWILGRIVDSNQLPFLQRIQSEFLEIEAKGELDWKFFDAFQRAKLERILKNPQEFYENVCLKPKGAVERVKNQLSYKLGAEILKTKNPMRIFILTFKLKNLINHWGQLESKTLNLDDFSDYYEGLKTCEHLSYSLGFTFLKAYTNWYKGEILLLPFKFYRVYRQFKEKRI
ncbi:glycosyltransferase family 2 protein [Helicobacter ganmani]|uniref:glycosyltransferase family 2 protein n=1 Tax=Helicobacter ganmani TaxID=60246 RepID=UPI003A8B3776